MRNYRTWNPEYTRLHRAEPSNDIVDLERAPGQHDLVVNLANRWYLEQPWVNYYTGFNQDLHRVAMDTMEPIVRELNQLIFHRGALNSSLNTHPYGPTVTSLIQHYLFDQRLTLQSYGPMTYRKIDALREMLQAYFNHQISSLWYRMMYKLLRIASVGIFDSRYLYCEQCMAAEAAARG